MKNEACFGQYVVSILHASGVSKHSIPPGRGLYLPGCTDRWAFAGVALIFGLFGILVSAKNRCVNVEWKEGCWFDWKNQLKVVMDIANYSLTLFISSETVDIHLYWLKWGGTQEGCAFPKLSCCFLQWLKAFVEGAVCRFAVDM